jgi:hypothetical protein
MSGYFHAVLLAPSGGAAQLTESASSVTPLRSAKYENAPQTGLSVFMLGDYLSFFSLLAPVSLIFYNTALYKTQELISNPFKTKKRGTVDTVPLDVTLIINTEVLS